LIITSRSKAELEILASELRQEFAVIVDVVTADLSIPGGAQKLFDQVQARKLSVDLLINNAGFGKWTHFLDESLDTYDQMLSININALTQLTYLFIPSMLAKRNGGVINAASTAAFQPLPYIAIVWGLESICVKSDGSPRG
jgi:short-subunit dehydrogenase